MQTMAQLKSLHQQMAADLARLPQYRALKAMDRFLVELGHIYDGDDASAEKAAESVRDKVSLAVENRVGQEAGGQTRVTPYIPGNRVA